MATHTFATKDLYDFKPITGTQLNFPGAVSILPPTITDFTPTSGPAGGTVTITGTNFGAMPGAMGTVKFNGILANVVSWSNTVIVAKVPVGGATGNITVTTAGGTATSIAGFTVTVAPAPWPGDRWLVGTPNSIMRDLFGGLIVNQDGTLTLLENKALTDSSLTLLRQLLEQSGHPYGYLCAGVYGARIQTANPVYGGQELANYMTDIGTPASYATQPRKTALVDEHVNTFEFNRDPAQGNLTPQQNIDDDIYQHRTEREYMLGDGFTDVLIGTPTGIDPIIWPDYEAYADGFRAWAINPANLPAKYLVDCWGDACLGKGGRTGKWSDYFFRDGRHLTLLGVQRQAAMVREVIFALDNLPIPAATISATASLSGQTITVVGKSLDFMEYALFYADGTLAVSWQPVGVFAGLFGGTYTARVRQWKRPTNVIQVADSFTVAGNTMEDETKTYVAQVTAAGANPRDTPAINDTFKGLKTAGILNSLELLAVADWGQHQEPGNSNPLALDTLYALSKGGNAVACTTINGFGTARYEAAADGVWGALKAANLETLFSPALAAGIYTLILRYAITSPTEFSGILNLLDASNSRQFTLFQHPSGNLISGPFGPAQAFSYDGKYITFVMRSTLSDATLQVGTAAPVSIGPVGPVASASIGNVVDTNGASVNSHFVKIGLWSQHLNDTELAAALNILSL